jgi:ketosteroid isomerase-like protein
MTDTLAVATRYVDALQAGDFATVASMFADDIGWHQPGSNRISGTYRGAAAVGELLGATMTLSEGTFRLAVTGAPMVNGDMCAFGVHFSGKRSGADISMDGVDLLRSRAGRSRRCGCSPPCRRMRTPSGAPAEREPSEAGRNSSRRGTPSGTESTLGACEARRRPPP